MTRAILRGLLLLAAAALPAAAQIRLPGGGARPATAERPPRAGTDTTRDTTKALLVKWAEPDSVARQLLEKSGYSITRYQGDTVTFNATTRGLMISAPDSGVAAVKSDTMTVIADSSIAYSEQTGVANASGGRIVLRQAEGQPDLVASGRAAYNLRERSASISGARTIVNSGEDWVIQARLAKVKFPQDSSGGQRQIFGVEGLLTSCTDTINGPDYHFGFKEIKKTGNTMVARPAVLYIKDVPVLWLPFVFQDMRSGRHSGFLPPIVGFTDIVRNAPSYRRKVENIGYFWALNDYMDFEASFDWRSGASGATTADPGWMKYNAEWRYRVLDRFLQGSLATIYTNQNDGRTNLAINWTHRQELSKNRSFTSNVNWVKETFIQRQTSFNPYQVVGTIRSQVNYADKLGPFSLQLGGSRVQYPGRSQVDQQFPTLTLTAGQITIAPWLVWTPNFSLNADQSLKIDQPGTSSWMYRTGDAGLDSVRLDRSSRRLSASFDTPLQIFGWNLRNAFQFSDQEQDFPQSFLVVDVRDTSRKETRLYARTFRSELNWNPSFSLPPILQGKWNFTPSLSLANVDPGPFAVRSERSGGAWVTQSKRFTFGAAVSPTIFGLLPGFGPVSRFRHAINPSLSWSYAPKAEVSDEYLEALGRTRAGYLGSLAQNQLTFGLNTNLEAKLRAPGDSNPDAGRKIRLLSLNFSSLGYDFERARETKKAIRGLTSENFGTSIRSDLLPGVDLQMDWSLFQGSALSDTAVFKPYRTRVAAGFQVGSQHNPFAVFARLFGRAVPATSISSAEVRQTTAEDDAEARRVVSQPVAGSRSRESQFVVPPTNGWNASFTFSSSRQRPPVGNAQIVEFDPARVCEPYRAVNPLQYDFCLAEARSNPSTETPITSATIGGPVYRIPPTTSLGSNVSFNLTPHWSASWQTNYDFERKEFASHMVSLQRDLHDWRAVFAFTQAPNGNFAFNFFIALKAEPDLKFDYHRTDIRRDINQ